MPFRSMCILWLVISQGYVGIDFRDRSGEYQGGDEGYGDQQERDEAEEDRIAWADAVPLVIRQ
jgi:hypothetical protein